MTRSIVETLIGAIVLAVAIGFIVFAYSRSSVATVNGYEVFARFTRIDGLNRGADVRIGGIKVGSVVDMSLDPKTYLAIARFSIAPEFKLPTDSSVAVVNDGLLGGKYVSIEPGGLDEYVRPGGELAYTQSSIQIDQLIGKFVFDKTDRPEEKKN
jgi:phospholipid/cholesterol/gamma-HCH transport system substrate-binding protein